jgi:caffeoyl-CoA O-methyltransferase
MVIVAEEIERYVEAHTTPPPDLLRELAGETRATLPQPQMLTGPVEGRLLQTLVWVIRPRRVLELGTYSGYSALSMAPGLPEDGVIHTCEIEGKHAEVARRYIERSPYAGRIHVHLGPALETAERLGGEWDFVFIDADKAGYRAYYDALLPRLSGRGLMAVDNTLAGGNVVDPGDSERTRLMADFNDHVMRDERSVCVLLTVRDGVTLIRRAAHG